MPINDHRIVHIIPSLSYGGAERIAVSVVIGLRTRGYRSVMLTLYPPSRSELERQLIEYSVPTYHLKKHSGPDFACLKQLYEWLDLLQPTIIHSHLRALHYVLPWIWLRPHVRAFHTVHTMAELEVNWALRQMYRLAFRSRVVPVGVGPRVRSSVNVLYGTDRCIDIPNGIPVLPSRSGGGQDLRKHLHLRANDIVLICVARMSPEKNLTVLLRIFERLADDVPDVVLLLVGDGPDAASVNSHIGQLRHGSQVRVLGFQPNVYGILAISDLFVLCSIKEGRPLAVMEAMSVGLPVVCYAVGGIPDLIDHGYDGLLVSVNDEENLLESLKWLCAAPERRVALGNAARAKASEAFSVDKMIDQYQGLYE